MGEADAVRCPYCGADDDRVLDSRATDDGTAIRRRRTCNACGKRFTTYERVETEENLRVVKRDGSIELFDRRKLLGGLLVACGKRPVSSESLEALANRIQQTFQTEGRREISSRELGERVMQGLRDIDEVAYVRFASVYRQFKDLDDFMSTLRQAIGDRGNPAP
jgi:transcriptional repressor NrdR